MFKVPSRVCADHIGGRYRLGLNTTAIASEEDPPAGSASEPGIRPARTPAALAAADFAAPAGAAPPA